MSDEKLNFISCLQDALELGSFVKLTLGKRRGGDESLKKLYITLVNLRGNSELSFLYRYDTRDVKKNLSYETGVELISELLGSTFLSGHLFKTDKNIELAYSRKLKPRLSFSKPTFSNVGECEHDKKKSRFIEADSNEYLKSLGVVSINGKVAKKKEAKFRQINKFIEVVDSLIRSSDLLNKDEISVVDMGAGKGYLTFALYDYLVNTLNKKVSVVGVEARIDMVNLCNSIANQVGFHGLSFVEGYINNYELASVDMVIALHACDTATDDALYKAIKADADVIVCSPCCHKELNSQLEVDDLNSELISFGILRERQATMITDTLRAMLLKSQGYKANVFEFISSEHTGKNLMISAIKSLRSYDEIEILDKVDAYKSQWGVKKQHLDELLRS